MLIASRFPFSTSYKNLISVFQEMGFCQYEIKIITRVFKRATAAHYHKKGRFSWKKFVDDYFPIRSKGFTFMSVFPTENLGHWTKGFVSRISENNDDFSKTNVQN